MVSTTRRGKPEIDGFSPLGRKLVEELFGEQLMDEVIRKPTLDDYLDKNPRLLTWKDYVEMSQLLHDERAVFIEAERKKKYPDPEENTDDEPKR